ncbi:MAG: DUF1549 domain-containing protein, partial [Planctomycetaceae bacterium]|nr:DUF1549 domain-containing protein [Planctomycetaceae bacterium]
MRHIVALCLLTTTGVAHADDALHFEDGPQQIFASKCVRCHGDDPLERKAELNLQSAAGVLRGGESGPVIAPGKPDDSLLWTSISDGVMPPEGEPGLTDDERATIRKWIEQGAPTRSSADGSAIPDSARQFWSFQPLHATAPPAASTDRSVVTPIDRFLAAELDRHGLAFSPPADRRTLIRRLSLDLLGVPPDPADVAAFESDESPDAYEQLVDRLLSSPHYGERWGRHWLDVTGYSDSNGYHRADTPRPLAYRFRDYIVAALNADKPYDRLWTEQLAGDEIYRPEERDALRADVADALIATHFLRNGPDGTDSTEGNEMVQTIERYAVLEQQLQITITAMFGLTIDCARCHSHKFDPIPQTDYYALQSLLYPAFNVKEWVTPKNRTIQLATADQRARHDAEMNRITTEIQALRDGLRQWSREHRPAGSLLFADGFADDADLSARWSNAAPGDDGPAGTGVHLDSDEAPAAKSIDGTLHIIEAGGSNGWLSTQQSIDWTPNEVGGVIQATFDLVADKRTPDGTGAERIGFYLATRDYNDSTSESGGNILCDGVPDGGANITVDYPGADSQGLGTLGKTGFKPGHNYGVRISNLGDGKYQLELLVDWLPDEGALTLSETQLPDGGFGFEFCCGRCFVVDNIAIEAFSAETAENSPASMLAKFREQSQEQTKTVDAAVAALEAQRSSPPGEIAWVTDLSPTPAEVHLLKRGRYFDPGPAVVPAALTVLSDAGNMLQPPAEPTPAGTTGRRLAFAEWATRPGSRAAALLARVQVNRLWMWHFGRGLVDPADNFGAQGTLPSHPELLEWLATEFTNSGWSTKHIQRLIVMSAAYRQSTEPSPQALTVDPADRLLWGFPVHRLESEAIRDSMLRVAGVLDDAVGGPPAEYQALPNGQVILNEDAAESATGLSRRTIYYRHRRSEPVTFLQTFDQPAVEPNCLRRGTSAVVSQTLAMLNSEFSVRMSRTLAERIRREVGT